MKVLFVINVDFSLRHFLLPLMRGARARGHEVLAACAEGPLLAPVRVEGFRVVAVPLERGWSLPAHARALRALTELCRAERPDVVHAHMPISGLLGRLAARRAGVRRVAYTSHGFLFNQPGPWARRGASLVLEWAAGRWLTDVLLTVSEVEAADARRLGLARSPVAVGNGRDPARFRPDAAVRARVRATLGVPEDRKVVISVARLVAHKGLADVALALRDVPDAEFWVVGERLATDRGPDVAAALRASGLGDRPRLLGYREDVADLLAAADVFALASRFEGLPMAVIEAMLCGLPVVACDIRGPREQVVDGETGLLVPQGDVAALAATLRDLLGNPARRVAMGTAGRARAVDRYDEARVVARTLDALGLVGLSAAA